MRINSCGLILFKLVMNNADVRSTHISLEHSQQYQASVLQIYPAAIDGNRVPYHPSDHLSAVWRRLFVKKGWHVDDPSRVPETNIYPTLTTILSATSIPDDWKASLRSLSAAPPQRMFVAYLL